MTKKRKTKATGTVNGVPGQSTTVAAAASGTPTKARVKTNQGTSWLLILLFVLGVGGVAALGLWLRASQPEAETAGATTATTTSQDTQVAAVETRAPVRGPADYCRKQPNFAATLGFSQQALVSTSQNDPKGLVVFDVDANGQINRTFQDPTWDDAGWLGHITLDQNGNIYTFPAPRENLVDNPPEKANILYRVDSNSVQMTPLITLTAALPPSPENSYGIMGTALDCDTNSLYAATVAGSTRAEEVGKIVRVDLATGTEAAEYPNVDPFGVSILTTAEGKRLYYGLARSPELYSIALDSSGNFTGEPRFEVAMPDPNFKVWRVKFLPTGELELRGLEFDFNLRATSQRREVAYTFRYEDATETWQQVADDTATPASP